MLKDKVVVITGASSGIGAEIAQLVSKQGAVTILLARSLEKLKQVSEKMTGKHEIYQVDVTSTEQINEVMDDILTKYQRIDVLINNAGFGIFKEVADSSLEEIKSMMDVNYLGMVRCTKAALPAMLKEKSGHIINVASVAGKMATAKSAGYTATKFAMIGFSDSLRHELKDKGITVSTVNPGPIDTPFFDIADPSGNYVKNVKWMMLTPQKVAKAVLDVIIHKKREKTIPYTANIGVKLYHLFPRTFDRFMSKMINRK